MWEDDDNYWDDDDMEEYERECLREDARIDRMIDDSTPVDWNWEDNL